MNSCGPSQIANEAGLWTSWGMFTFVLWFIWWQHIYLQLHDEFAYRVFNKKRRLAKFAGYFTWTCGVLFFGNYLSLNTVFMCFHQIKKPKFNDVCLLFKHSNFCSRMLEMHSKGPRFQNFGGGHPSGPPRISRLQHSVENCCQFVK